LQQLKQAAAKQRLQVAACHSSDQARQTQLQLLVQLPLLQPLLLQLLKQPRLAKY
jgi:hypothetical protein